MGSHPSEDRWTARTSTHEESAGAVGDKDKLQIPQRAVAHPTHKCSVISFRCVQCWLGWRRCALAVCDCSGDPGPTLLPPRSQKFWTLFHCIQLEKCLQRHQSNVFCIEIRYSAQCPFTEPTVVQAGLSCLVNFPSLFFETLGSHFITVISATGLITTTASSSKGSYVVLSIDGRNFQTNVSDRNEDPEWNDTFSPWVFRGFWVSMFSNWRR